MRMVKHLVFSSVFGTSEKTGERGAKNNPQAVCDTQTEALAKEATPK